MIGNAKHTKSKNYSLGKSYSYLLHQYAWLCHTNKNQCQFINPLLAHLQECAMSVCIVMEYYKNGDLGQVLRQKREAKEVIDEQVGVDWKTTLYFVYTNNGCTLIEWTYKHGLKTVTWLIWITWTSLPAVQKKAVKLNHSPRGISKASHTILLDAYRYMYSTTISFRNTHNRCIYSLLRRARYWASSVIITHAPLFRGGADYVYEFMSLVMNIHDLFMHCATSQ